MKRLVAAVTAAVAVAVALVGTLGAYIDGGWPETCLEMNDMVEASEHGSGAVGIYQRAFGDQAEQACRNDHIEDVRRAFAWAIPTPAHPPTPAPATASAPSPDANVESHADYSRVLRVAQARGAGERAAEIAASVIARNAVDAFLRGTDTGEWGYSDCQRRSDACPLAPTERIVTGKGEGDSAAFGLEAGTYRVDFRYWDNRSRFGATNFIAYLYTLEGNRELVVNEIAISNTKSLFYNSPGGMTFVRVRSAGEDAKWEVKIRST